MRKLYVLLLTLFVGFISSAQTAKDYSFAASTGSTLDPMTGSTSLVAASSDDGASAVTSIGFSFVYEGVAYTQFSANVNGLVKLGSVAVTTEFTNSVTSSTNVPKLMPCWDDHHTGTVAGGGKVHTVLIGSSPNQIRVIEWFVTIPRNTSGVANARFQCWLYEGTNVIEYRYGSSGGSTASATYGLGGATTSNYLSVTTSAGGGTALNSAANNANTIWPGNGTKYSFTPPLACSGTPNPGNTVSTSPSVCSGTSFTLSIQNSQAASGITYQWQSSTDGTTYADIAGATSGTYAASQTVPKYYQVKVTCTNSSQTTISTPILVGLNAVNQCYCSPNTGTTLHSSVTAYVTDVAIASTSFAYSSGTTAPANGYLQVPVGTATGSLQQSVVYTLNMNLANSPAQVSVWVDFNQNGTFESGEYFLATISGTTSTANILVPTGAVLGQTALRIRSRSVTYTSADACTSFGSGETEDYVITITAAPSCLAPTIQAATSVTSSAATLNWTAPASASSNYEVYYSTSSTPPTGATTPNFTGVTGTSQVLSGLTSNTSYYAWVRSNCGGSGVSGWSATVAFTTPCNVSTVPYVEDFESLATANTLPSCMISSPTVASSGKTQTYIASATSTNSALIAKSGTKFAAIYYSPNAAGYFFSAPLQLTGGVNYTTSVFYKTDGVAWPSAGLKYGTAPSVASMTNSIATITSASATSYTQISGSFTPATTGVYYVSFYADNTTSNAPNYMSFDDFTVDVTPSCVAPVMTSSTLLTSNSATLNWNPSTSSPSSYELYYSTSNTAPTGATVPSMTGITSTSQAISGLTGSTTYYAWVRSNCGGSGVSTWSASLSFTTLCNAITTLPFSESFDAATLPSCWSTSLVTGTTNWAPASSNDGVPSPHTGANFAGKVYTNSDALLVSPLFNLNGYGTSQLRINVWIYRSTANASSDRIRFYVNTTSNLTGAQQILEVFPLTTVAPVVATAGWYNYTADIPVSYNTGASLYVIAQGTTTAGFSSYGIGFDDFVLEAAPTTPCAAPADQATGLTFGAQGTTSQPGSFTAASSAPSGYLVVRSVGALNTNPVDGTTYAVGATLGNGVVVQSGSGLTFTATGLTGNTDYTFTVIDYNNTACLGGPVYNTHALSGDAITCTATPASLTFPYKTASSIQVSWTSPKGGNAVSPLNFIVDVSTENTFTTGIIPGSPLNVTDTTTSQATMSYTINGLNPATTYYVRIKLASGCNTAYSSIANTSTSAFDQDDASGAVLLTHTNYSATCSGTAYTTVGATTSGEPSICFSSSQDDDIWFKFVATDTKAILKVSNYSSASGTAGTFYYGIYTGNPGTLTELDCELSSLITTTNGGGEIYIRKPLVVGQTYYIRALTSGTGGRVNFNLCVTTPDVSAATTANTCVTVPTVTINSANANTNMWVPIYTSDAKLVAEINGNGNTLGVVTAKVYRNTNAVRTDNSGKPYLDRNLEITPAMQPASGTVSVRIYLTASEFAALKATANSQVSNITDLGVFKNNQLCGAAVTVVANPLSTSAASYESNYYVSFNVPSFSSFFIASNAFSILPANILTFSGVRQGAVNNLKWVVAQEIDVQTYQVERSSNGADWNTVGTVNSLGNTASQRSYTFTDNNVSGSKQLYRLRQVDRNGSAKLSNTIVISGVKPVALTLSGLFPNPADSKVNVMVEAPVKDNITIVIMDAVGRVVKTQKASVDAGSNTLEVNTAMLAAGSYMLKLTCDSNCQSAISKFVKQ